MPSQPHALAPILLLVLSACPHESPDIECIDDDTCNRFEGGRCVVYPATGNQWCSYPDSSCESKRRWSDLDVGDGLEGMCMESMADAGIDSVPPDARTIECFEQIAFVSDRDGNLEIYRAEPSISQLINITSNEADDSFPRWSPTGEQIAFVSTRDGAQPCT